MANKDTNSNDGKRVRPLLTLRKRLSRLVLAIVVMEVLRIAYFLAILNSMPPSNSADWKPCKNGYCIDAPMKEHVAVPGYSFEHTSLAIVMLSPDTSLVDFLKVAANPLVRFSCPPSFEDVWQNPNSRFYSATGQRIARPANAEMNRFTMTYAPVIHYTKGAHNSRDYLNEWPGVFKRLSDLRTSLLVARQALARTPTAFSGGSSGYLTFWSVCKFDPVGAVLSSSYEPLAWLGSGLNLSNSSPVFPTECWTDPHSQFFASNGKRMACPIPVKPGYTLSQQALWSYRMVPHLTLLCEDSSGKLAGGYWWGEFHERSERSGWAGPMTERIRTN